MSMRRPYLYLHQTRDRRFAEQTKQFTEYPSYRSLLRALPNIIKATSGNLTIYRQRRGQWGEWFERYENGVKVAEGWM